MRSSVSYMLSHASGEPIMSHPDYEQEAHHHGCLLVLVRGIGPSKPRCLQRIFERIQKVNNVKITDSSGQARDIWIRYVRDYHVENNDWGDFQTHRRLLGVITVGKFDKQTELNELCRIHESLKVKYMSTLYDSRCILFGPNVDQSSESNEVSMTSEVSENASSNDTPSLPTSDLSTESTSQPYSSMSSTMSNTRLEDRYTTPQNFKSRAFFYRENDLCENLEGHINEYINSLFWVLESKRLERTKEKIDKITILLAPFEKKDFVGLDMESRTNKKRFIGRVTKNLADLTLQSGLVAESLNLYHAASETLRAIGDLLWQAAAYEGLCAASTILMYPYLRQTIQLQRNASLQPALLNKQPTPGVRRVSKDAINKQQYSIDLMGNNTLSPSKSQFGFESNTLRTPASSSTSSMSSIASISSNGSTTTSGADDKTPSAGVNLPANILQANEIPNRYREAIVFYTKYRNAAIIETEASLKAARICIEQGQNLEVANFLQNVLFINLNMSEQDRVLRFETLTELYQRIGYNRKASFCQRLAAWRHIAQGNTNPDWNQNYKLLLDSFSGHKLSLDPIEVLQANAGWPCLQIDLLQQLVAAARRLGHSGLATRHMTFLLQTMWKHLPPNEQKEMALQLQSLSAQCEGAPVPLVLENGTIIPPSNLTDIPYCETLTVQNLLVGLRPQKVNIAKVDNGPFLFTPIHFNSIDRRDTLKKDNKLPFQWVQNEPGEVVIKLVNPLPFDLTVIEMRLLSNGVVFETVPQTIQLQPNVPRSVTLSGTPIEAGILEVQGFSTHTLGVKSNCRLKNMIGRSIPPIYLIDVVPAMPRIKVEVSVTELIENSTTSSASLSTTPHITLYNGEQTDSKVIITNESAVPIEFIEASFNSNLDLDVQSQIFKWSLEELQSKLPVKPNESIEVKVSIFAYANFIGPHTVMNGVLFPFHQMSDGSANGPPSINTFHGGSSLGVSGLNPNQINGFNSPTHTQRRSELTSSFRSSNSGHSSLATTSMSPYMSQMPRHLDVQFRVRYSGGQGYTDGYCRLNSVTFNMDFLPSAQITNWDVLPAEIPSQFYLVLDVINLTTQEMCLNYTDNKNILIEAKESCRVPVPVERCSANPDESPTTGQHDGISLIVDKSQHELVEKICAEHISSNVKLNWTLGGTENKGIASLKGISLSPTMLDLITVSPLQWEVSIDKTAVSPQAEVTCTSGQYITLTIKISNISTVPLNNLVLTIQFYQDYKNGIHNYRLETRLIMSGPNQIFINRLNENEDTVHECSVLFLTPGRFKADIQCRSSQELLKPNDFIYGGEPNSVTDNNSHVWRFIPSVELTVTE